MTDETPGPPAPALSVEEARTLTPYDADWRPESCTDCDGYERYRRLCPHHAAYKDGYEDGIDESSEALRAATARAERLERAARDVLGKMKPVGERPAHRQIHERHLRQLRAALSATEEEA